MYTYSNQNKYKEVILELNYYYQVMSIIYLKISKSHFLQCASYYVLIGAINSWLVVTVVLLIYHCLPFGRTSDSCGIRSYCPAGMLCAPAPKMMLRPLHTILFLRISLIDHIDSQWGTRQ